MTGPLHAMSQALAVSERDLKDIRSCREFLARRFRRIRDVNPTLFDIVLDDAREYRAALDARLSMNLPNYRPVA